jgi:hypothetical protein
LLVTDGQRLLAIEGQLWYKNSNKSKILQMEVERLVDKMFFTDGQQE